MENQGRIILSTHDSIYVINLDEILYCSCNNSSTTFHLLNKKSIIVSKSIKTFENELGDANFFRPHQSYLINLRHLVKVDRTNAYTIILSDQSRIPTSIRKRKALMQILNIS